MARAERVVVFAALLALPVTAHAVPLRGQIRLPADYPGRTITRWAGFWLLPNDVLDPQPPLVDPRTEMVVTLEGSGIVGASLVKPVMRMEDARFAPATLAVAPHTSVLFENHDGVVHRLEAVGRPSIPTQVLQPKASFSHRFDTPGSYPLRCAEILHMRAVVFVTGAPLFIQPDQGGAFVFPDLRPGTYTLSIWYREKWIHRQEVTVKANKTAVDVQLQSLAEKD